MPAPQAKLIQCRDLVAAGKARAAASLLRPLARSHPGDADVNMLLCLSLGSLSRWDQAAHYGMLGARGRPGEPAFWLEAAAALQAAGRHAEAMALLAEGVGHCPHDVPLRLNLANALLDAHRAEDAAAQCRAALGVADDPEVLVTLGNALLTLTEIDEGVSLLREASERHPGNHRLLAALCAAMNYTPGLDPAEVARAHRRSGDLLSRSAPTRRPEPRVDREPGRRLRVGFMSPDLRSHSVAYFLEPLISHLDRESVEPLAYFTSAHADAMTARLRPRFALWRDCAGLSAMEIAARVTGDRVDILIDLAGHTLGGNPAVLALKPAPVLATYLGYPNTTGLPGVDYRIVDSLTDPEPGADALATERLIRIDPCFLCYAPPPGAPMPAAARPDRPFTFGSFNASQKINAPLLALWARVLHAAPGSRLVLKALGFADAGIARRIAAGLASHGIAPERLSFLPPPRSLAEHLACYDQIDAALDTQPYHGTTTTCETLLMGVPVVTLAGRSHAQRVGVSLLTAVGLPELIAPDEPGYVTIAASLAGSSGWTPDARGRLRESLLRSALCDAPGFARRFGEALRRMWTLSSGTQPR